MKQNKPNCPRFFWLQVPCLKLECLKWLTSFSRSKLLDLAWAWAFPMMPKVTGDKNPTSNHLDRHVTLENLNPFNLLPQYINEASNQFRYIHLFSIKTATCCSTGNVQQKSRTSAHKTIISLHSHPTVSLHNLPCHGPLDVVDPTLNPQTSGANLLKEIRPSPPGIYIYICINPKKNLGYWININWLAGFLNHQQNGDVCS